MIQQYFRCSLAESLEQFLFFDYCIFGPRAPIFLGACRHAMDKEPSRIKTGDFFSLPGELRNQIMEEVLVPGDVWVSRPPQLGNTVQGQVTLAALMLLPTIVCHMSLMGLACLFHRTVGIYLFELGCLGRRSYFLYWYWIGCCYMMRLKVFDYRFQYPPSRWKAERTSSPNFEGHQFLAASKQTLREGSGIFFPKNAFHLPPGSMLETWSWWWGLGKDRRHSIGSLVCDFSLLDLSPVEVHLAYLLACLQKLSVSRDSDLMDLWRNKMLDFIWGTWCCKTNFILGREETKGQQSLCDKIKSIFKHERTMDQRLRRAKYSDEMRKALHDLDCIISRRIRDLGPQGSKSWLTHLKDGEGMEHIHTTNGMLKRTEDSWRYEKSHF